MFVTCYVMYTCIIFYAHRTQTISYIECAVNGGTTDELAGVFDKIDELPPSDYNRYRLRMSSAYQGKLTNYTTLTSF